MNEIANQYIVKKICNIIDTKYDGNFAHFYEENQSLNQFLNNSEIDIVMAHLGIKLTNEDYYAFLKDISENYKKSSGNNKPSEINGKKKILSHKNIDGFVDALILAFITGSCLGIIMLNLYSKIVK